MEQYGESAIIGCAQSGIFLMSVKVPKATNQPDTLPKGPRS